MIANKRVRAVSVRAVGCLVALVVSGCQSLPLVQSKALPATLHDRDGVIYSLPRQSIFIVYELSVKTARQIQKKIAEKSNALKEQQAILGRLKSKKERNVKLRQHIPNSMRGSKSAYLVLDKGLALLEGRIRITESRVKDLEAELARLKEAERRSGSSGCVYEHKLTVKPLEVVPDPEYTFVAKFTHHGVFQDQFGFTVKNGLLEGASGVSEDRSAEIIESIVEAAVRAGEGAAIIEQRAQAKCEKKLIKVARVVDPDEEGSIERFNEEIREAGVSLRLCKAKADFVSETEAVQGVRSAQCTSGEHVTRKIAGGYQVPGLWYRQPGIYRVELVDGEGQVLKAIDILLAQGGAMGWVPIDKGRFSKREYALRFNKGALVKMETKQGSEVAGFVSIIPESLKALVAIPAEMIKFRVDYASGEANAAEAKAKLIEKQIEIEKLRQELEILRAEE